MLTYLYDFLTWANIMAPPYKQSSLSSPNFSKQCLCTAGGPDGTQRCPNKCFCDLPGNSSKGLPNEAEELRRELLEDKPLLEEVQRNAKACGLVELRICSKDLDAGRNFEVAEKILMQRRKEEGEPEHIAQASTSQRASGAESQWSFSRLLRQQSPVREMVAPPTPQHKQTVKQTPPIPHPCSRPLRPADPNKIPATPNNQTVAALIAQMPTPPTTARKPKPTAQPSNLPSPLGTSPSPSPLVAPNKSTPKSSRFLGGNRPRTASPIIEGKIRRLEEQVQDLQTQLEWEEREKETWFRKYQKLRTLYDKVLALVEEDDEDQDVSDGGGSEVT